MKKFLLVAMVCLALSLGAAQAATPYDDVEVGHWAYSALDYLTENGIIEGYPDGFFKGDRTLTRYEFAQATSRLLDTIGGSAVDADIQVFAQSLRAEFSDQLAEINRGLVEAGAAIQGLDTRIGDLEGAVESNSSSVSTLEAAISGLKPGPNWQGQLRYRWQFENRQAGGSRPDAERFRQRIRFILGYSKQINDAVKVAFRFKTKTGVKPTSGNHDLGNYGQTANIYLDRAYVVYSPSWFGWYTKCSPGECGSCGKCTDCNPKLDIIAGLFPNITHDPNQMIFDSDVNLQGVALVYHFNQDFQIMTAASVMVEVNGTDYMDDDAYLFITELKHDNLFTENLDAWIGAYGWKNENVITGVFKDNSLWNFDFNDDGVTNGADRFTTNFHTVKAGLEYTWDSWFDKPFSVFGEYMINIDSDAEDRINAVNPLLTPAIIYENSDDYGWVVGTQYGAKPKYCQDWYVFAKYREIGANATIDGFSGSSEGGANTNSLKVGWAYMWADNSLFGVNYYLNKVHNAFGFLVPDGEGDFSEIQMNWIFKF